MASRTNTQTTAHLLHDAGLAVWLGGSLMGAVGVNGASADLDDPGQRARAASDAWARWTPVNAAAIGAHLLGGALLLKGNKGRVKYQKGVKANTGVKLALTGSALAATAYARLLGKKVIDAGDVPVAGGTEPLASTPQDVADHVADVADRIEEFRILLRDILTVNGTLVAQRQNEDMQKIGESSNQQAVEARKISAWAAILFAPSIISGIYGMNFHVIPELSLPFGYPAAIGLMAAVAVTLYVIFRKRKWL